ncbi:MAG: hypothetical protein GX974_09955 [Clostridiales bacterium]|nr:hypothetical protein [Clostridiales bacterium]
MKQKYLIYITLIVIIVSVLAMGCSAPKKQPSQEIELDSQKGDSRSNSHSNDKVENDDKTKEESPEDKTDDNSEDSNEDIKHDSISKENVGNNNTADDNQNNSIHLAKLLPHREGYTWVYDGAVEYGHSMSLDKIDKRNEQIVYSVSGRVDDMSDGESKSDFSIELSYTIIGKSLVQIVDSETIMDSEFPQIELIRLPLSKGNTWTQKQKNSKGKTITLESSIDKIENDGKQKIYTVTYRDRDSEYYERRKIKEGVGVIYFEHLFSYDHEGKKESMPIGYSLNSSYSGYANNMAINKFLPPLNSDRIYYGIAEYGHKGSLKRLSATSDFAEYEFNAIYNDGTGIDGSFKIKYNIDYIRGTVTEEVLENTRAGKREVNSKVQPLVILKAPFKENSSWSHKAKLDGKEYTMVATIKDMDDDKGQITVEYKVEGVPGYYENRYIEERTFELGRGMVSFSNLLPGDIDISATDAKDSVLLQKALLNHMFGYILAPEE